MPPRLRIVILLLALGCLPGCRLTSARVRTDASAAETAAIPKNRDQETSESSAVEADGAVGDQSTQPDTRVEMSFHEASVEEDAACDRLQIIASVDSDEHATPPGETQRIRRAAVTLASADDGVAPVQLEDSNQAGQRFAIDLPTALRLAGGDNWSVRLARERICEAQARLDTARAMWLPSLNLGIGWTKHDGKIQATPGQILDVSRNSLFVGGGAAVSRAPTTGGAGGPARLFVDLSIADAIFEPLARRQLVCAEQSRHSVVFNDTLLEAALAYYELVGAQARVAVARENIADSAEVVLLTEAFVAAGKASRAEITRVRVAASRREQEFVQARLAVKLTSAELARILQLDPEKLSPETALYTLEERPVPVEFVPEASHLQQLVLHAKGVRPEVAETWARAESDRMRYRAERWRPFIPNLNLGVSAGVFGGGIGSHNAGLDGRSDVDALLVWKVDNLGYGVRAARRERASRYRQAAFRGHRVQDIIATEVAQAWHRVHAQRETIELSGQTVDQAVDVFQKNMRRIRGLEGLPLEALQSLEAVGQSRADYLNALMAYNRAQLMLLRSIGRPVVAVPNRSE